MKYEPIKQTSRPYEYGEGKEFSSRDEAKEVVEKRRQVLITELALNKAYSIVEIAVIEIENAFQLVATIKKPIIFEENQE